MEINNPVSSLYEKYPPSEPCSCEICVRYCKRPGWWTVSEAEHAIEKGLAGRMMFEISPDFRTGVLSPAFKGNEGNFALKELSENGCTFLKDGLCELSGTGLQPLECRFCHHERKSQGLRCHIDIGKEWESEYAKRLIIRWGRLTGFWGRQGVRLVEK
jgi:hypothetical protein